MKIKSRFMDEVEIEKDQIIVFPEGLPAFEAQRQFVIIPFAQDSPFFYLQSVADRQLCFILADIFTFFPGYEIEIGQREIDNLKIGKSGQASLNVFTLLTIPEVFSDTTANLLAPVIVNFEQRAGVQLIPEVSRYHTKHPLFEEVLSPAQGGR